MYRMIKTVNSNGIDSLNEIANSHSLEGNFYIEPETRKRMAFIYNDNSEKVLISTSLIWNVQHINNQIRINTGDSEFWFEKVEG